MSVILWNSFVFIMVIGVLVFVHEFGHFIVAKWCGVGVLKFSIGFGPRLLGVRRGETVYQICAIPLGGFVRMVGDMPDVITGPQETDEAVRSSDSESAASEIEEIEQLSEEQRTALQDRSRWFIEKNLWQRSAIVFAGPLFNFLFTGVLIFVMVFFYGQRRTLDSATIGGIHEGSPSHAAGLKPDDVIKQIGTKPISNWVELAKTIHNGDGQPVNMVVERKGELLDLLVTPKEKEIRNFWGEPTKVFLIGIEQKQVSEEAGFLDALRSGAIGTVNLTYQTYLGLWGMVSGRVSPKDLAGPKLIFDEAGERAKRGFEDLLFFMAILSVSLAVLNLLPIPILDGGHLLFFFLEAIFGPLSMRKKEFAQQVGFIFLLFLMVFALHNDFTRDPESMKHEISWADKDAGKTNTEPNREQAAKP